MIYITKHYFPDTNVLVNFVSECNIEENKLANKLFEATNKKLIFGIIPPSVEDEFNSIFSDESIKNAQGVLKNLIKDSNNSKPIFIKLLGDFFTVVASEKILLDELQLKVKSEKSFDETLTMNKLFEVGINFKIRRIKVLKLLGRVKNETMNSLYASLAENIKKIQTDFGTFFPIKKEKDEIDNQHILNSALICKANSISGSFITNDNLRVKPVKDFKKNCDLARKSVKTELSVTLFIEKLHTYCKFKNLV